MKKIVPFFFALFLLLVELPALQAQTQDPSELFLKAYMTSQQAEKLEHDNQYKAALQKFQAASILLEELRKSQANWQPAIVEYRARKIGESIQRVQARIGTQLDLAATNPPPTPITGGSCPRRFADSSPDTRAGRAQCGRRSARGRSAIAPPASRCVPRSSQ